MKILIVGPSVKLKGGISSVLKNYLLQLDSFEQKGIKIDFFFSIYSNNIFIQLLMFPFLLFNFYYKIVKYDIIHIHVSSNGSFVRKNLLSKICNYKGKPYIVHLHGSEFKQFYKKSPNSKQYLIRHFFNNAEKVIVLGNEWKKFIENLINEPHKVFTLNNAVPKPAEKQEENLFKSNNTLVLGFLGRIGERKGVYDLIKCIDSFPESSKINLKIAGDGEEEFLKRKISEINNNYRFQIMGWIDKDQRSEFLKDIDVFVLPSYNEGLPMSILEAMSYGKAVISTNVGSIEEAVKHGENGLIIQPGNKEQLYQAINKFLRSPDLISEMGSKSKNIFNENFLIDTHINKLINLYQSVKRMKTIE